MTEQKAEDLIARRVLNGLGLTEKQIWDAEKAVFGDPNQDDALWVRTLTLLKAVWRQTNGTPTDPIMALWTKRDHKDVIDRYKECLSNGVQLPIIMARIKETETSITYQALTNTEIGLTLHPPYSVIVELEDRNTMNTIHLAVQETSHYIKQFGPYEWLRAQLNRL